MADPLPDIDSLWDYHDPAASESRFRELWARVVNGADEEYEAELLTQLARSVALQQKFDVAHRLLDQVEASLPQRAPRVRVRYLLERGRTFNSSGRKGEAGALFEQAWDSALAHGLEALAVDAAHMVAIARPAASLEWNLLALEKAEQSDEPRARLWRGSLYNNLGWTFVDRKEYATAHRYFVEALACRREQGDTREIQVARWCVAKTLRLLGRLEESLQLQQVLDREQQEGGSPSGYTQEEIAECLLALGQAPESKSYFRKAHELLQGDPWLGQDEPERLQRLYDLSLP